MDRKKLKIFTDASEYLKNTAKLKETLAEIRQKIDDKAAAAAGISVGTLATCVFASLFFLDIEAKNLDNTKNNDYQAPKKTELTETNSDTDKTLETPVTKSIDIKETKTPSLAMPDIEKAYIINNTINHNLSKEYMNTYITIKDKTSDYLLATHNAVDAMWDSLIPCLLFFEGLQPELTKLNDYGGLTFWNGMTFLNLSDTGKTVRTSQQEIGYKALNLAVQYTNSMNYDDMWSNMNSLMKGKYNFTYQIIQKLRKKNVVNIKIRHLLGLLIMGYQWPADAYNVIDKIVQNGQINEKIADSEFAKYTGQTANSNGSVKRHLIALWIFKGYISPQDLMNMPIGFYADSTVIPQQPEQKNKTIKFYDENDNQAITVFDKHGRFSSKLTSKAAAQKWLQKSIFMGNKRAHQTPATPADKYKHLLINKFLIDNDNINNEYINIYGSDSNAHNNTWNQEHNRMTDTLTRKKTQEILANRIVIESEQFKTNQAITNTQMQRQ